jgi:hypothetical protein
VIARYSKKFAYAPYLNEDIGWEKSIPDNATEEEMIQAQLELNRIATEVHKRLNPHLFAAENGEAKFDIPYGPIERTPIANRMKKEKEIKIGTTPEDILSSPDLKTLITYKFIIKGKPDLQKAYDKRMKELDKSPTKKTGKPVLP